MTKYTTHPQPVNPLHHGAHNAIVKKVFCCAGMKKASQCPPFQHIPAWAGNNQIMAIQYEVPPVHPRMGGEKIIGWTCHGPP